MPRRGELLALLAKNVNFPGVEFHPGVSYRNLMVYRGTAKMSRQDHAAA